MSEEIKEIVDKLSNRKQETLIQGLREYQLKDIEHPFITKEEYIDKLLNYITSLQHKVEQLEKELQITANNCKQLENIRKEAIEYINKNWGHWCSNHYEYATETINILNKGDNNVKDKR